MKISDYLSTGAENGRKLQDLVSLTGLPERTVRQLIKTEREAGTPILSDNFSGYFLMSTPAEARRFTRSMRHRAREILDTAAAVEKAAGVE